MNYNNKKKILLKRKIQKMIDKAMIKKQEEKKIKNDKVKVEKTYDI